MHNMVWQEAVDDEGRVYYYEGETTQWERPEAFKPGRLDELLAEDGWERYTTDDGEVYYYSEKEDKSVWELPEAVLRRWKEEQTSADRAETAALPAAEEIDWEDEVKEVEASGGTGNQLLDGIPTASKKGSVSAKDAKDSFLQMLEELGVDSSWPFSRVMEQSVRDERYWAVEDPLTRKQLYEMYLMDRANEELKKAESSKKTNRKKFRAVLESRQVKRYSRWQTVWRETQAECPEVPKRQKKEFFEEYLAELNAAEAEAKESRKKEQLEKLKEAWAPSVKFESQFEPFLKDLGLPDKYPDLTKLDVLAVFETLQGTEENEFNEKVKASREQNYRSDRRARDAFKRLLASRVEPSPTLRWHELLAKIGKERAFVDLCGHRGSSAIDFYWDLLDRENQLLRAKRDIVRQLLAKERVDFGSVESADQFVSIVTGMERGTPTEKGRLTEKDLRQVYKLLKDEEAASASASAKRRRADEDSTSSKRSRLATLGYGRPQH